MVFVLRSLPSHITIDCRCPTKKRNRINILLLPYYVPEALILSFKKSLLALLTWNSSPHHLIISHSYPDVNRTDD